MRPGTLAATFPDTATRLREAIGSAAVTVRTQFCTMRSIRDNVAHLNTASLHLRAELTQLAGIYNMIRGQWGPFGVRVAAVYPV
jgi:hypothetical protein